MNRRPAAILCALVALLCLAFGPCSTRAVVSVEQPQPPKESVPPPIVTPAKPGETDTEAQLRQARDAVSTLAGDLARWKQRVATLTADRDQDRRDAFLGKLRTSCLWVAGIALLGALACAVLAFVSPIAKPTLVKIAAGCGLLVALATGCAWCVPWLPAVGVVAVIVLCCLVVAASVLALVKWWPSFAHAAILSADGYQRTAAVLRDLTDDEARVAAVEIDAHNRGAQLSAGWPVFREGDRLHYIAKAEREKLAAGAA